MSDNNENTRKEIDIETPQKKNEDITTNEEETENSENGPESTDVKRGNEKEHKERENPDNPAFQDTEQEKKQEDDTALINDEDKERGIKDARKDSILDNPKYETYENNHDGNKKNEELKRQKNPDTEKSRINKNKQFNQL